MARWADSIRTIRLAVAAMCGLAVLPAAAHAQLSLTPATQPAAAPVMSPEGRVNSEIVSIGDFSRSVTLLPHGLLWQPSLASPSEPRSYMKIMNLSEKTMPDVNDCNIGGTLPLVRVSRLDHPDEGFQTDIFATVMSRFVEERTFAAVDYRFGVPFTYAIGPWSFKTSYEHTSCHVGDEFLLKEHLTSKDSTRNEAVFGIAFKPLDALRLYAQIGYGVAESSFVKGFDRWRYTCGVEWSKPGPTSVWGQPYAAMDLEFRGDEDYTPNFTAQIGWQWLGAYSAPGFRIALEYYDGRSPFGQFIDQHESWEALGFYFDF